MAKFEMDTDFIRKLAAILEKEHATLWINHDKAQTDTLKHAPEYFE